MNKYSQYSAVQQCESRHESLLAPQGHIHTEGAVWKMLRAHRAQHDDNLDSRPAQICGPLNAGMNGILIEHRAPVRCECTCGPMRVTQVCNERALHEWVQWAQDSDGFFVPDFQEGQEIGRRVYKWRVDAWISCYYYIGTRAVL